MKSRLDGGWGRTGGLERGFRNGDGHRNGEGCGYQTLFVDKSKSGELFWVKMEEAYLFETFLLREFCSSELCYLKNLKVCSVLIILRAFFKESAPWPILS